MRLEGVPFLSEENWQLGAETQEVYTQAFEQILSENIQSELDDGNSVKKNVRVWNATNTAGNDRFIPQVEMVMGCDQ